MTNGKSFPRTNMSETPWDGYKLSDIK